MRQGVYQQEQSRFRQVWSILRRRIAGSMGVSHRWLSANGQVAERPQGQNTHFRRHRALSTHRSRPARDEAVTAAGMFAAAKPPFRVKPNKSGFVEGVDPLDLNRLLDDLAIEDFLAKKPQ